MSGSVHRGRCCWPYTSYSISAMNTLYVSWTQCYQLVLAKFSVLSTPISTSITDIRDVQRPRISEMKNSSEWFTTAKELGPVCLSSAGHWCWGILWSHDCVLNRWDLIVLLDSERGAEWLKISSRQGAPEYWKRLDGHSHKIGRIHEASIVVLIMCYD